ncbi:hypothetical protein V1512DRAFT_259572, partial [Lipomyces arxii]|uniref:uncharacterized protein n=1 Tax=Lipomyces arxii TaxID=56418 RepID=UPI0034CDD21E
MDQDAVGGTLHREPLKKPRLNGRIHKRPLTESDLIVARGKGNVYFRVSAKSPFISLLKRAKKEVVKVHTDKVDTVVLMGLSHAIEKTLSLGLRFQAMGYIIRVETETIVVKDDFEPSDVDSEWTTLNREVSLIKVRISARSAEDKKKVLVDID